MSSNMERVAAMPDASLYVNRDGERADDCVDSHGGGAHLVVGGSLGIFYSQSGQYPRIWIKMMEKFLGWGTSFLICIYLLLSQSVHFAHYS